MLVNQDLVRFLSGNNAYHTSFNIFTYATVIKPGENMAVISGMKQAFYEDF